MSSAEVGAFFVSVYIAGAAFVFGFAAEECHLHNWYQPERCEYRERFAYAAPRAFGWPVYAFGRMGYEFAHKR